MNQRRSMAGRFLESYSGDGSASDVRVHRYERLLMGTWNVILLVERPESPLRPAALDAAAAGALELMAGLEAELSKFEPDSEVSLMNSLAAGRPVVVSATLLDLLEDSRRFWEITRGAFDPTVGPLVRAWGFDDGVGRVPGQAELENLRASCGMDGVHIDRERGTVFFERPGIAFDPGAIGKGLIVDRAVAHLRSAGAADGALLAGRSSIVVWGAAPDGERWRVGVANPRAPDEALIDLSVAAGAISTSAAYERSLRIDGVDHGHVIDPRSGRPARRSLGVTVWTPTAPVGDVASTALLVLGLAAGQSILEDLAPISVVFLEEDSGSWGGIRPEVRHRPGDAAPGFEVVRE